ncbi:LysR family transcriptional regulator [Caulobacter sp. KR2-114]|uniref:LysR family transcriptional regulator n=1 Tax=Caulobacter sp. KR2-114 TaxID=3400912 RepID=UPI003C0BA256
MDVRQLRQVTEICDAGSFSRAAEVLGLSQPALSRSIARLERDLGLRLFDRSGRGAQPTDYARHIADQARRALSDVSTVVQEVRDLAEGRSGAISIGVGAAARAILAAPLAVRLTAAYPRLSIQLVNGRARELITDVAERRLDMVITTSELVPDSRDLVRASLFRDEVCFFARPGHPLLARRGAPDLRALLDYPLASPGVSPVLIAKAQGYDARRRENLTAYLTHDYGLILDIVRRSDAIGQAPLSVYPRAFAAGEVVRLPSDHTDRYHCVSLVHRAAMASPVIRRTLELAKAAALDLPDLSSLRVSVTPPGPARHRPVTAAP